MLQVNVWNLLAGVRTKLPPKSKKESRISKLVVLLHSPMKSFQPSPKLIAPRHSGLTLTPADGASILWYPNSVFGFAGGAKYDMVALRVPWLKVREGLNVVESGFSELEREGNFSILWLPSRRGDQRRPVCYRLQRRELRHAVSYPRPQQRQLGDSAL